MSTRVARSIPFLLAGLAGLTIGATAASAQEAPLSGPKVTENRPKFDNRFSGSEDGKFGRKEPMGLRPVPLRAYVEVVMKLRGGEAPADLRLSDEQQEKIKGIMDEFRNSTRQRVQPRRQGQAGAEPDRRGGSDKPGDSPKGKGQGNRRPAEQYRDAAPLMADCETRIYATLTRPQQKFVDGEVQKIREEMERRAGEEYMKRQIAKRGKAGEPGAAPPPPEGEQRERAMRILARLRQLDPRQREEIFKMLERELDKRGVPEARPEPARRDEGKAEDSKPAPSMDEVSVPAPKKSR